MADPKEKPIPQGEQTYPTPELNEETGAPLDTRFQKPDPQPEPKRHADPKGETSAARRPKSEEDRPEAEEDDDKPKSSKKRR